jgi:glutathione S-transferase
MMSYPVNSIAHTPVFGKYDVGPRTMAWIDRMRKRPAFKRAVERLAREDKIGVDKAKAEKAAKAAAAKL